MAKQFKRIGVLTSGGDAPGMNAAVRAVVRAALDRNIEVMGIYEGYKGLIVDNIAPLGSKDVSGVIGRGSTMLYSDRCLEFKTEEGMQKAVATCRKYEIDGIVAIGGDGTFRGATDLSNHGIPTIGVPATIDNDITSSDYCIGFDTALNTVVQMCDRLRDTCESHARCNVVEVMGRGAGYLALEAGIAVGAAAIAIPEIPFDVDAAIKNLIEYKNESKRSFIVMVAEGLGGDFSEGLAHTIQERTGIETKFCRLAHVVRGGDPTLRDRLMATRFGEEAISLLLDGKSNLVVCERNSQLSSMDINFALTADRVYKGKAKEEELAKLSDGQLQTIKELCAQRTQYLQKLAKVAEIVAY